MKLYELVDPVNLACARVAPVGDLGYERCTSCSYYLGYPRPAKRVVEWLEGSDVICSFVWPSRLVGEVLVTEEVRKCLQDCKVEFLPVEFYQDPRLKKPKRMTKRTKRRVWLPYEGPPLYVLWVTTWVHADLERSTLRLVSECPVCGHKVYDVEGVEERKHRWDPSIKDLVELHEPREEGKGIYIHQEDLQGAEIFRVHEQPGRICCTEGVKSLLEEQGFSNVEFLEVGAHIPHFNTVQGGILWYPSGREPSRRSCSRRTPDGRHDIPYGAVGPFGHCSRHLRRDGAGGAD